MARRLGAALGWLAGSALRIRRREVVARLARAGFFDAERVASSMYASLGAGLVELLLTALPGERSLGRVRLTPRAQQALEQVRASGAVVATAHTGNWDLAACAVASVAPLWVVSKRLRVRWLDRLWQALRARRGVRLLDARGALDAGRKALDAGALVAMIIDQAPERASGVLVAPFLGQPARHDLAPALLAARSEKPFALALARRLDDGSHEVDVPLLLLPPPRAGRPWAEDATQAAATALESFILRYPAQWLWLHRRWKDAPALPPRRARPSLSPGSP